MISIVSSMHKRDTDLWLKTLEMQTADIEVVLVVYNDFVPLGMQSDNGVQQHPFKFKVVHVEGPEGPYPEAWLKNIGIKASTGDVICCTNIDILYTEEFFAEVENNCRPDTLVEATRFDTPEGTTAIVEGGNIKMNVPETGMMNIVIDPNIAIPALTRAVGDCQAMRRSDWEELTGYNENFIGWGGLDTDLECRAILAGKSIHTLGFAATQESGNRVSHYHLWHPRDLGRMREEGWKNKEFLDETLSKGVTGPNEKWGEVGVPA